MKNLIVITFLFFVALFSCQKEPITPEMSCAVNIRMEVYKWDIELNQFVMLEKRITPACACQAIADRNDLYMTRAPELRFKYVCPPE